MFAYFLFVALVAVGIYVLVKIVRRFEKRSVSPQYRSFHRSLGFTCFCTCAFVSAFFSPLCYEFPESFNVTKLKIINPENPAQASYQKISPWGEWDHGTYISAQEGPVEIKRTFVIKNEKNEVLCLETVLSIADYPLFVFEVCRARKDFTGQSLIFHPTGTREEWVLSEISELLAWDNSPFEGREQKRGALAPDWFQENRITSAQLIVKNAWIKPVLNEVTIVR